jgi:hypothetical protein
MQIRLPASAIDNFINDRIIFTIETNVTDYRHHLQELYKIVPVETLIIEGAGFFDLIEYQSIELMTQFILKYT